MLFGVVQVMLRRLKLARAPRPALTPAALIFPASGAEAHFRHAFRRMPRHDFVAALGHLVEARRGAVERQTHGVENGALARARGPRDGKYASGFVFRPVEADSPFAGEGIEIADMNA